MVYLYLSKKEFTPEKIKEYNKQAISEYGNDDTAQESILIMDDAEGYFESIGDDSVHIVCDHTKLGYMTIDVKLTTEDLLSLVEIAVKKLNKFKTMLETL